LVITNALPKDEEKKEGRGNDFQLEERDADEIELTSKGIKPEGGRGHDGIDNGGLVKSLKLGEGGGRKWGS